MYRFKFTLPDTQNGIQYGTPQAEAVTMGKQSHSVYIASSNKLYYIHFPEFKESELSSVKKESPIATCNVEYVASVSNAIQAICSGYNENKSQFYVCTIDNCGQCNFFTADAKGHLQHLFVYNHSNGADSILEESWSYICLSPSGKRFATMHGLSSTVNIVSINELTKPCIINTVGHPRSIAWRDEDTIVITENKQLSQFYVPSNGTCTACSRITVSTNDITCISCFKSNNDIAVCTETDRGVFVLNSRELKIVKRWRAPIRSTVISSVNETVATCNLGSDVNILYMCGDDNELLMFNCSGKEEKDSALKERHSVNVRSRSRIIGLCIEHEEGHSILYMLGQNGDLDAIVNPCDFFIERRKRTIDLKEEDDKKAMMDD